MFLRYGKKFLFIVNKVDDDKKIYIIGRMLKFFMFRTLFRCFTSGSSLLYHIPSSGSIPSVQLLYSVI